MYLHMLAKNKYTYSKSYMYGTYDFSFVTS
jgi:hypothetical protein